MDKEQFIQEALMLPLSAISYHISQHLATRFPDRALLEGKELFLSSMMRWIAHPQHGSMDQVLTSQVDVLREQMVSTATQTAETEKE